MNEFNNRYNVFDIFQRIKHDSNSITRQQQQFLMSTKNVSNAQLCSSPETIKFQFKQQQEMHSSISITNLVDRIVNYKIKTNKIGLYLVKPMEGQIYNKETIQVHFKRKELTLENYDLMITNPSQREKFLIEFTSEVEDGVGIIQKDKQVAYLSVTFLKTSSQIDANSYQNETQPKKTDKQAEREEKKSPAVQITEKQNQLQKLRTEKQKLLKSRQDGVGTSNMFTLQDLIYTVIFSFMAGFVLI